MLSLAPIPVPYRSPEFPVKEDWIDYNGHLNMGYYVVVMDYGSDHMYDTIGIGKHYIENCNQTFMTVEVHVCYQREVMLGASIEVRTRILEVDDKRAHLFTELHQMQEGYLAATMESMIINVDVTSRKTGPWPADIRARLDAVCAAHAPLPWPERAGRKIISLKKT